ncbi:GntR family transcriptional regulator [Paenibacillus endoradicis]|uniref:GntR family transcriptional regulator n=1 Tax=Paenibacillus endoradicis TaxID=2972487 RepID=UPI002158D7A4|nr:GntR family transcriptional regulator [Paenibacillus endoradicis]MCR8657052.1 GntR family transcriptional regulator [Paenibacillus endoradicis]
MFTPTNDNRSIRDQVYEALKQQIVTLKILPGTSLSENEMAVQFNVSRTPIRESFVRLAQEGLVQVLPQRGTLVSLIDRSLVEEARFMRLQLECAIVEIACSDFPAASLSYLTMNLSQQKECLELNDVDRIFTLDQQFHSILFAGVNKTHTWNTMSSLTIHLDRSRKLRLLDNDDWEQIYDQHCQILEAIKNKDADFAIQIMKQHLNRGVDELTVLNEKYPNYFI